MEGGFVVPPRTLGGILSSPIQAWNSPEAQANRDVMFSPSKWPSAVKEAGQSLQALTQIKPGSPEYEAGMKYFGNPETAQNIALILNAVTPGRTSSIFSPKPPVPKQPIQEAFQTVQAKPTTGQLTRDADLMRFEIEQAKRSIPETDPLKRVFEAQNAQLMQRGNELKAASGGVSENLPATGKSVVSALERKQGGMQAAVRKAYQELSDDDIIMVSGIKKWFTEHKPELVSKPELARVKASLDKLLAGRKVDALTNAELERFKQIATNTLYKFDDPAGRTYAGKITDLVDDARLSTGTSEAFKEARFLKTLERSEFADQGIIAKLIEKTSKTDRKVGYEDVWKTAVKNSDINELKQVKNTLLTGSGEAAWNDLRLETLRQIMDKGVTRNAMTEGMEQVFSGPNFKRALESVGEDKLRLIFSPEEMRMLKAMSDVGMARLPPPISVAGTNINYSNTGSAVADMLDRIANVPGLRWVGGPLRKLASGVEAGAERKATKQGVYYATHPEKFFEKGGKELIIPAYQKGLGRTGFVLGTQTREKK